MENSASPGRLLAFQEGDEDAWQEIVEQNSPWLFALSLRLLGRADDAEDLVQECFLQAFRARRQMKDLKTLRGWLRTICVRLSLRKSRKQKDISLSEVEMFLSSEKLVPADRMAAARQEVRRVLEGLARLSPRLRSCLILSVFEGLSGKEISATVGISNGAVKRYIHDARHALHKILEE